MIRSKPKVAAPPKAERRKAERHARNLRISWRLLGNRDLHFGEAALKDIGTSGLALQVDRSCPKGTVVIVRFEGADEPLLLQAAWSSELPTSINGIPTYLMGCSFTSPLPKKDLERLLESAKNAAAAPAKVAAVKAPLQADPFLDGSVREKRSLSRRGGVTVPVVLCQSEGGTPIEASVVDRSMIGLGILVRLPFTRGTSLFVRPRDSHEKTLSVRIQVRNCRQKGKQWLLGCHFMHTPPANVLMLLG